SYSENSENIASLLCTNELNELNVKLSSEIELRLWRLGYVSGTSAPSASSPVLQLCGPHLW
ncbi:hypothetical protein TorRG33x02_323500, partial [Trema orientale]